MTSPHPQLSPSDLERGSKRAGGARDSGEHYEDLLTLAGYINLALPVPGWIEARSKVRGTLTTKP